MLALSTLAFKEVPDPPRKKVKLIFRLYEINNVLTFLNDFHIFVVVMLAGD